MLVEWLTYLLTLLETLMGPSVNILVLRLSSPLVLNKKNPYLGIHVYFPSVSLFYPHILLTIIGKTLLIQMSLCVTLLGHQCATSLT